MGYYADAGSTSEQEPFPAYGPVDSLLSFAMFYVFVDRATPTIVDVLTDAIPSVSPSGVGFAIAALLWFIFVVTLVDMARHQYEALASRPSGESDQNFYGRSMPDTTLFVVYAAVVVVGGVVAAWTFERVYDELETAMLEAWDNVSETKADLDVTWRDAAYVVGITRIAEAKESRGLWP
ncbi:hypothetical protein AUR66_19335 [Haloferax profundi]|uniref:Glutamate/phenylalanine/leucine/valine/L-tryptophan dehydrogenase C-terminal domain-containing protein n=1 Tax=Haloferax profundi TaxID=1544718 RepID=A0A0W1RLB4_9EURY|nr:hypothetical protein AUR66_19335 [Haloferax profundi]